MQVPDGIIVNDPRPINQKNPYTFFLPHPDEIAALKPGDGIKAIFHQPNCEGDYDTERMWVLIREIREGIALGTLDNEPAGLDKIVLGDEVQIPLTHAISAAFREDNPRPKTPDVKEYWDRCFVDACVLEGRSHVDYLYREEPDMTREGDKYPDSGWRIRGTQAAIDLDSENGHSPKYIALGKVLNADDSWIHLIDCDFDRHFAWDADNEVFVEVF